jgi:hypothetical protein
VHGPRSRAIRSLLEISHVRTELQDLLGAALARARKRRDRLLVHLLEAATIASHDIGGEIDAAGLALGQIGALWNDGGGNP